MAPGVASRPSVEPPALDLPSGFLASRAFDAGSHAPMRHEAAQVIVGFVKGEGRANLGGSAQERAVELRARAWRGRGHPHLRERAMNDDTGMH